MPDKGFSPSINLIRERQISLVDKFIDWALTAGRFIVIVTEIIALSAFLYRFSLDRNLIDLHQTIKQEQVIVENLSAREKTYRNLQERLTVAKETGRLEKRQLEIFKDIIGFAPDGATFNSFTLSDSFARMDMRIQNVGALTRFTSALREYKNVVSVSIDSIENRPAGGSIAVSITAALKKEQNKYGATAN